MPRTIVIASMPKKVKFFNKIIRISVIFIYGKYSLIHKIKKRDYLIFMKAWMNLTNKYYEGLKEKYGDENYINLINTFKNEK